MNDSINDFMAAHDGVHDRASIARWAWPAWAGHVNEEHKALCETYRSRLRAAALAALEAEPEAVAVEVVGGEVIRVVIVHDRPAELADEEHDDQAGASAEVKP